MRYFVILLAISVLFSCRKNCVSAVPDCINAKIEVLKGQPKGNPAYSVYQYDYNGRKVYYFPPQCCDQYSDLYDDHCNLICYPDGGLLNGSGNANCPDFFTTRSNEVLVWKDSRQ